MPRADASWRRSRCSGRSACRRPSGRCRSARPRTVRGAGCSQPAPRWAPLLDLAVELRGREKAVEVFRISLARRSSRTSRSSSASRCASSVVVPGRTPPSISAWRTQFRSASGCTPNWSATRLMAPHADSGSFRASIAIRVARCWSSTLYFHGAAMTLIILPRIESLHQTQDDSLGVLHVSWTVTKNRFSRTCEVKSVL